MVFLSEGLILDGIGDGESNDVDVTRCQMGVVILKCRRQKAGIGFVDF